MQQSILLLFISTFCIQTLFSQEEPPIGRWTVSAGVGAHFGVMFQGYGEGKSRKAPPSYSLTAERRMGKVFELGFQLGWSPAELFLEDMRRGPANTPFPSGTEEDVTITARRTVAGVRTMFHYLSGQKADLYSGLRLGIKHTARKTDTGHYNYVTYTEITEFRLTGIKRQSTDFSMQIVLLGYRYLFNDHLGFGLEVGIGAPYYSSVQVVYRI